METEDKDPGNMLVRAGYLQGLSAKLEGQDKLMVQRASASLIATASTMIRPANASEAMKLAMNIITRLPESTEPRIEQIEAPDDQWLVVVSFRRNT